MRGAVREAELGVRRPVRTQGVGGPALPEFLSQRRLMAARYSL